MGRYDGIKCPACGVEFKDKDDIVVCPTCGAPHHRHCYEEQQGCVYVDKHATGEEWRRPSVEKIDGDAPRRCPRCGTLNQVDSIFCELCGTPLNNANIPPKSDEESGGFFAGMKPPVVMEYNPYTTPYGGLSPDESIDGIPVKDIAMFVGSGSHYYLPRFKEMVTLKKNVSWNWAAFLGNALYFCGRGMYMIGSLLAVAFLIRQLPSTMATYYYVAANINQFLANPTIMFSGDIPPTTAYWLNIANIFSYIYWATCMVWGLFGNKLYQRHVFSQIRQLKERFGDGEEYKAALVKKGGLKTGLMIGLVVGFLVLSFAVAVIVEFSIVA